MDSYYAAYYGSGLKLNEKEFVDFLQQYMEATGNTKASMIKHVTDKYTYPVSIDFDDEDDVNDEFSQMVICEEIMFTWGIDLSLGNSRKRTFCPTIVSPDDSDGMNFYQYYANGRPNTYYKDEERETANPDYVDPILLRDETSYVFYSDRMLDSVNAFERRPYSSYQEFEQEFKNKMAAYLPDDFDWDAHIGRFSYARYA